MKECPKCGGIGTSVIFRHIGASVHFEEGIDGVSKFKRGDTYYHSDTVIAEHLIYTCNTCGYRKAEPTKDQLTT